jgi:hypothetical protein
VSPLENVYIEYIMDILNLFMGDVEKYKPLPTLPSPPPVSTGLSPKVLCYADFLVTI